MRRPGARGKVIYRGKGRTSPVHQQVDLWFCRETREAVSFGKQFDLDPRVNSPFVKSNMAFSTVRSNLMLNIKKCFFHVEKNEISVLFGSRYQNPSFGIRSIFISTEFLACLLNSSQWKIQVAFSVFLSTHLMFNRQILVHWDKRLALTSIWFAFYLYEEPILIPPNKKHVQWQELRHKGWNFQFKSCRC